MKRKNVCRIGGQAVLEGVMMRGRGAMATAVRDSAGAIEIESARIDESERRKKLRKIPILRGIASFFDSFVVGMRATVRSTAVFGADEAPPTRFEKWLAKTFKIDALSVATFLGAFLGIFLAVALFVAVPQICALGVFAGVGLLKVDMSAGAWNAFKTSTAGLGFGMNVLYELARGAFRLVIFILYLWLIGLSKSIKRLFMYHGAEHCTIACYESGLELTPDNASKMSVRHDRCGTTFLVIVMVVSVLFFTIVPVSMLDVGNSVGTFFVQLVVRLLLIPIVAGAAYEFLIFFANRDNLFARACKAPGLWLQALTTRRPDPDMLEVAIASFKEVFALESDPDRPLRRFDVSLPVEAAVEKTARALGKSHRGEAELICAHVLGVESLASLRDGRRMPESGLEECLRFAEARKAGAPLQRVLGVAWFYGRAFRSDGRALIPRQDTEILVEQALKRLKPMPGARVLDLCCGSGCIALTIKSELPGCDVTGSDISSDALALARENAELLGVDAAFVQSDLFARFAGVEFDAIISNPPYVRADEFASLPKDVSDFDPRQALFGGSDGLDFYRRIIPESRAHLRPGGFLALECGAGQADSIKALLTGFEIETHFDYNSPPVERVIIARPVASTNAEPKPIEAHSSECAGAEPSAL